MWCRTVRRLMGDFVEGTLTPRRESRFRRHLDTCEACREDEAALRVAYSAFSVWRDVPPPEDGLHRLETRLAFSPPPVVTAPRGTIRQLVLPYVAGLATAAAVLLLARPWAAPEAVAPSAPNAEGSAVAVADDPPPLLPNEKKLEFVDQEGVVFRIPWDEETDRVLRARFGPEQYQRLRQRFEFQRSGTLRPDILNGRKSDDAVERVKLDLDIR